MIGVLLLQLGTPDSPHVRDVRRYLREFLSDPRVLDVPAPARRFLVEAVILPFRPRRSARQYASIWSDKGSPLLIHTQDLGASLQQELGHRYRVAIGMRYQNPSIESALEQLNEANADRIVIVPLFPQYSSAATGSAVARSLELIGRQKHIPSIGIVPPFYHDPGFTKAAASVARPLLADFAPDHVLFSYHGLPEQHIVNSHNAGARCVPDTDCSNPANWRNTFCYRAQSYATTGALAKHLDLRGSRFSTAFQSRLAGQRWIRPHTDRVLHDLHEKGVRRIAVLTPSFVADCLETLEEIGIRLRKQWTGMGGTDLLLVPCVNATARWTTALAGQVRASLPARPEMEPRNRPRETS